MMTTRQVVLTTITWAALATLVMLEFLAFVALLGPSGAFLGER